MNETINEATHKKFVFYEFGVDKSLESFDAILEKITKSKQAFKQQQNSTINKNKTKHVNELLDTRINTETYDIEEIRQTKSFSIKDFQTMEMKREKDIHHSILRFRTSPPLWKKSAFPSSEMIDTLYRVPCRDPSGKVISTVSRDEKKGAPKFKVSKGIDPPTFDLCSPTFQATVKRHLEEVINKVEEEYIKMPSSTQHQINLKARVGADLANLKRKREAILFELKNSNETKHEVNDVTLDVTNDKKK